MASINLTAALAFIDEDEGPELNVSASEPGGSSKHGVSMTVLEEWHAAHGLSPPTMSDMRAVDAVLAGKIYTARFANPIRFNDLPGGVDYRLLDIAVNLGVGGGIRLFQASLKMRTVTGKMDDETVANATNSDAAALVHTLSSAWLAKKQQSPSWGPNPPITKSGFGRGWTNRNNRATARALSLIGA